MLRKMSRFVVCVSVLLLTATTVLYARRGAVAVTQNDLGTRSLENVKIEAQSIGALLEKLSLHYDIPIGVEIASNDDERVDYQLDFKKGSLSDLLNEFVARHDQYAGRSETAWSIFFRRTIIVTRYSEIYWRPKSTVLR